AEAWLRKASEAAQRLTLRPESKVAQMVRVLTRAQEAFRSGVRLPRGERLEDLPEALQRALGVRPEARSEGPPAEAGAPEAQTRFALRSALARVPLAALSSEAGWQASSVARRAPPLAGNASGSQDLLPAADRIGRTASPEPDAKPGAAGQRR